MNFLSGLPTLAIYSFLLFTQTWCTPLEPTSEEQFNEGVRQWDENIYNSILLYAIPAASSGKHYIQTQQGVDEECTRTAKVFMQFFEKPSAIDTLKLVMSQSVERAVKFKMNSTLHEVVNIFCQKMYKNMKLQRHVFSDKLEELRTAVQIPKPAKNYILELPSSGQNVKEWVDKVIRPFDDPELLKFEIIWRCRQISELRYDEKKRELIGIAKTILSRMIYTYEKQPTVNEVFTNAMEDFVKNVVEKVDDTNIEDQVAAFLKKVDQYFLSNQILKEEYSAKKKESTPL